MRLVPLLLLILSCTELGEFATMGDEIYTGEVIGTADMNCEPGDACSFIRRGFAEETELQLQFDPRRATSTPGTLTTTGEPCGPTFDGVALQPIPALFHDHLSDYDFPGEPKLRSYIFALRPETGPLAGRDAMAFVSLIRGGDIEIRIVAGSGASDCNPDPTCDRYLAGECDYFGFFHLKRSER